MFEYLFTSVALLFFTLGMVLILESGRRIAYYKFKVPLIINLIFFFGLVKVALHYAIPAVLNIFSNYRYVREDNVELFNLVTIYAIEFVSWLAWLVGFLFIATRIHRKRIFTTLEFINFRFNAARNWLVAFVVGYVYLFYLQIFDSSEIPFYLVIIKSLLVYGGPPSALFLFVYGIRYYSRPYWVLGMVCSILSLFMISTRGALVYSVFFLMYVIYTFLPSRKNYTIAVFMLFSLVVMQMILGGLFQGSISLDEDGQVQINQGIGSDKKNGRSNFEEIEWRLGASTRMSTEFINMYDRGDGAGINPIKNSLLGFLPRSIHPEKPHPSTLHGDDIYSQGMYLIYREIHGYDTFSMVEFSSGGHAYWEFGWLGVVVLGALSGVYIALCAHYFPKLGVIAIPLMVAVFKPWGYVDPKIWVSDIVIQIYQIILPLTLVICIVSFARQFKKTLASQ